jgi:hypothetical protein
MLELALVVGLAVRLAVRLVFSSANSLAPIPYTEFAMLLTGIELQALEKSVLLES